MTELKRQCVQRAKQFINSDNVFQYLEVAQVFQSPRLEGEALDYIESNLDELWGTKDFIEMLYEKCTDEVRLELERLIDEYEEKYEIEIRPHIIERWNRIQAKRLRTSNNNNNNNNSGLSQ